jgi:hypothetical protein
MGTLWRLRLRLRFFEELLRCSAHLLRPGRADVRCPGRRELRCSRSKLLRSPHELLLVPHELLQVSVPQDSP